MLNKLLDKNYTESKYRKQRQAFDRMYAANQSKFVSDEAQVEEINAIRRSLEREKIKYRDERRSYNKQNYTDARFDEVMDLLVERLDDFGKVNFKPHRIPNKYGDKSMIVCLSDLHIGLAFDSYFSKYDSTIAKKRLEKYLSEIIDIAICNNVADVYVVMLGDSISNSLHKTIEIQNKENVIDQLKLSIEYITSFCHELTEYFNNVYFASASGNHSRLQAKDFAQHSERLDAFIAWDVCRVLSNQGNFHELLGENIDDGISKIKVCGKTYLLIHGDYDQTTKQGYLNLANMVGFFPDYILCGHKHFCSYSQDTKFIQSGSLCGSGDDYCVEKRLSGQASQMVCVCNEEGLKGVFPVIFG